MQKKIKPIIGISVIALIIILFSLNQKYLVAATVNGKTISRLAVVKELEKQGGKDVLDSLVTKQLIIDKAAKENITVSQKEIDNELKKIEESIKTQGGTLDEALKQKGIAKADLSKDLELQVMLQKLVKVDNIKVADEEVEKYLTENKELFAASKEAPDKAAIKEELKQEKVSTKIQEFLTAIRKDAKISYFGFYKQ